MATPRSAPHCIVVRAHNNTGKFSHPFPPLLHDHMSEEEFADLLACASSAVEDHDSSRRLCWWILFWVALLAVLCGAGVMLDSVVLVALGASCALWLSVALLWELFRFLKFSVVATTQIRQVLDEKNKALVPKGVQWRVGTLGSCLECYVLPNNQTTPPPSSSTQKATLATISPTPTESTPAISSLRTKLFESNHEADEMRVSTPSCVVISRNPALGFAPFFDPMFSLYLQGKIRPHELEDLLGETDKLAHKHFGRFALVRLMKLGVGFLVLGCVVTTVCVSVGKLNGIPMAFILAPLIGSSCFIFVCFGIYFIGLIRMASDLKKMTKNWNEKFEHKGLEFAVGPFATWLECHITSSNSQENADQSQTIYDV